MPLAKLYIAYMIFSVSICSETDIQNCHLPIPAITFNSVLKIMIYVIIQLPDCMFQGKNMLKKVFQSIWKCYVILVLQ